MFRPALGQHRRAALPTSIPRCPGPARRTRKRSARGHIHRRRTRTGNRCPVWRYRSAAHRRPGSPCRSARTAGTGSSQAVTLGRCPGADRERRSRVVVEDQADPYGALDQRLVRHGRLGDQGRSLHGRGHVRRLPRTTSELGGAQLRRGRRGRDGVVNRRTQSHAHPQCRNALHAGTIPRILSRAGFARPRFRRHRRLPAMRSRCRVRWLSATQGVRDDRRDRPAGNSWVI